MTTLSACAWCPNDTAWLPSSVAVAYAQLVQHLLAGNQGRPWCRWVEGCIRARRFFVTPAVVVPSEHGFVELIEAVQTVFKDLESTSQASRAAPVALTVLLSSLPPLGSIEPLLMDRRPALIADGLMMALLHPESRMRSLTSEGHGHPYQASHSFLTIRRAVQEDEVFVRINPVLSKTLQTWLASSNPK